jgi:hypothetical protein
MSIISLGVNKYPIVIGTGMKCSSTVIVRTVAANNFNRKKPIYSHNRLLSFYIPEICCSCYQQLFKLGHFCASVTDSTLLGKGHG